MKRLIWITICFLLLALLLSACSDAETTDMTDTTERLPASSSSVNVDETSSPDCAHELAETVVAPSCTQGYTLHYCQKCSYSYSDTYVEAIGHKYQSVVTEPTCTKSGYTTYTCSVCKHSYQDAKTDALGHRYGDWVITTEATPTKNGVMTATCSGCGKTKTKSYEHAENTEASKGLTFVLSSDKKSATLTGLGVCGDRKVTVPSLTPEGAVVTKVAGYAFENSSVTEVILPDSMTEIEDYAFAKAPALKTVNIPEGVLRIGTFLFAESPALETVLYDAINCKYAGKSGDWDYAFEGSFVKSLVIGDGVEAIPQYLCSHATRLESVTFGKSLTAINYNAFEYTKALKKIVFPEGLLDIYDYAFSYSALSEITLPESIESIRKEAFFGCPLDQDSLTLGPNLVSIGDRAFVGTVRIGTLTVDSTKIYSLSRRVDGTFTDAVIENVELCEGITTLPQRFLYRVQGLKAIVLPDSFESVPESFLAGACDLASVTLGQSTKIIKSSAFAGCEKLTQLVGTEGVESLGDSVFASCHALTSVSLTSATSLGKRLFAESGITAFTFPIVITVIPEGFFEDCSALLAFSIPSHITKIEKSAFKGTGITALSLPKTLESFASAFVAMPNLKTVTLENGMLTVDGGAFAGCTSLSEITLPDSITSIGAEAFNGCLVLKTLSLPSGITELGAGAFEDCKALEGIVLPIGLDGIAQRLFKNCTALKSVSIPEGVTAIGNDAFLGTALESVTIPDRCTLIGANAFRACQSLISVSFGQGLTSVKEYAFAGCEKLKRVALPDTVERIERFAFSDCDALEALTLGNTLTYLGSGAFMNAPSLVRVYLPASLAGMKINTASSESLPFAGSATALMFYTSLAEITPEWRYYFGNVIPNTTYDEYLAIA